jgi:hypothetical protein
MLDLNHAHAALFLASSGGNSNSSSATQPVFSTFASGQDFCYGLTREVGPALYVFIFFNRFSWLQLDVFWT